MAGFRLPFPIPQPRQRGGARRTGGYGRRQRPMFGTGGQGGRSPVGGGGLKMRLLIGIGFVLFALVTYYANPGDINEITGQRERVAIADEDQEMALGQQAAPQMVRQHGGPSRLREAQAQVDRIGRELLVGLEGWMREQEARLGVKLRNPYRFEFTLLADRETVNAFALPGGQVFITEALYGRLDTVGQVAGVLGHEIGHVIERHGNERMAKQKMFSTMAMGGGAVMGDPRTVQAALSILQNKYGREDELESDKWGVILTERAGYDPRAMIGVMRVLDEASPGGGPPEMMSTHPKPANRIAYIQQVIKQVFPDGVRSGLEP